MNEEQQPIAEIIGRQASITGLWPTQPKTQIAYDATRPTYEFWDKLRRGMAKGYELAGLFCRPITEIVAGHVLGDGIGAMTVAGDAYTDDLLRRLMHQQRGLLVSLCLDLYALGDQYVVVNPDGSLTMVTPDVVSFEVDEMDYRRVVQYTITTKLEKVTITDTYRETERTLRFRFHDGREVVQRFENLIGRIPIVHFANDRGVNEVYGRPVYEAARRLLSRYDDLLMKALHGAELMGNPVPVFQGLENINETLQANGSATGETYVDAQGKTRQRIEINFESLPVVLVGKGGAFNLVSPNAGFTDDIRNMLKSLFLLILDHTRIPEFVWGGAVASSKASAETQMPPFLQYIEGKRRELEGIGADPVLAVEATGGLLELVDIWLRMRALLDPRVAVGPVTVEWPELDIRDEALRFQWTQYLNGRGYLSGERALELSRLVKDAEQALEEAKAEQPAPTEGDDFGARVRTAYQAAGDG